jgi:hypothetical protein
MDISSSSRRSLRWVSQSLSKVSGSLDNALIRSAEWIHYTLLDPIVIKRNENMDLLYVLDTLGQRINRWYESINAGGCCVYAAIIGAELEKRGIETRIIVAAYGAKNNIEEVKNKLKNPGNMQEWEDNNVWFNHVGVEFKYNDIWYHYDSDGTHRKRAMLKEFKIYPGRLAPAEAWTVACDENGWNDSFNRRQIPSLKRHVKKYLATMLPQ